jgi:hypothetical protein
MPLHSLVQEVVATYLELAHREAAGLVEGLYLVGSAALGDFRPLPTAVCPRNDLVSRTGSPPHGSGEGFGAYAPPSLS